MELSRWDRSLRGIRKWARGRRAFGLPKDDVPTVIIWGPDGEILREVPLDDYADDGNG